jgi:lycopene epsilon-cyclase
LLRCCPQHLLHAFLPECGNQVGHDAGNDVPFVNNYGVWVDEFRDLGLEKNLNRIWQDALCYFGEDKEVRIGRQYGRVCRRKLRKHLLQRCQTNGVQFMAGMMDELETEQTSDTATIHLADGQVVRSRSAAGKRLQSAIFKMVSQTAAYCSLIA